MTIFSAMGYAGVLFYVSAYAALQLGFLRGSAPTYTILNMLGATCVLISLAAEWNLFSAIISIFWIGISVVGLSRRWWLQARLSFSDEDTLLLSRHLPTLPPIEAFQLIRIGRWTILPKNTQITKQGEPVGKIFYLSDNIGQVYVGGKWVAEVEQGGLVGEMTFLHGGPATADVILEHETRVFVWERPAMLKLLNTNSDLSVAVGAMLQSEAHHKLRVMTHGEAPLRPTAVPVGSSA